MEAEALRRDPVAERFQVGGDDGASPLGLGRAGLAVFGQQARGGIRQARHRARRPDQPAACFAPRLEGVDGLATA